MSCAVRQLMRGKLEEWTTNPDFSPSPQRNGDYSGAVDEHGDRAAGFSFHFPYRIPMNLTLKVWRQSGPKAQGKIETYDAKDIPEEASFLEMLDIVNERLVVKGAGADPFRPRLPRRHLRDLLAHHQRHSRTARTAA